MTYRPLRMPPGLISALEALDDNQRLTELAKNGALGKTLLTSDPAFYEAVKKSLAESVRRVEGLAPIEATRNRGLIDGDGDQ